MNKLKQSGMWGLLQEQKTQLLALALFPLNSKHGKQKICNCFSIPTASGKDKPP